MIHITQASVDALEAAVNAVDRLILLGDQHNGRGRCSRRYGVSNETRVECHREMRTALLNHRKKLQALYVSITGRDPWEGVPF